jgi:hypothetical protein
VLLGAAFLFMLIAIDVFGDTSLLRMKSAHLLPHHLDVPVHTWVKVRAHVACLSNNGLRHVAPSHA